MPDKPKHNLLGTIINPPIIALFLVTGFLFQNFLNDFVIWLFNYDLNYDINFLWFGYLGVIFCCFFHYQIEVWQRKTGQGKYEKLDALYGSLTALIIGLVIATIHILQNFI